MSSRCSNCAAANEQIEGLQEILFDPSSYRTAYRENMEGEYPEDKTKSEIFEVLKRELVSYAESNASFKKYLLSSLGASMPGVRSREPSLARSRTTTQSYTPRIKSHMIYTPRSSSRPSLD